MCYLSVTIIYLPVQPQTTHPNEKRNGNATAAVARWMSFQSFSNHDNRANNAPATENIGIAIILALHNGGTNSVSRLYCIDTKNPHPEMIY